MKISLYIPVSFLCCHGPYEINTLIITILTVNYNVVLFSTLNSNYRVKLYGNTLQNEPLRTILYVSLVSMLT